MLKPSYFSLLLLGGCPIGIPFTPGQLSRPSDDETRMCILATSPVVDFGEVEQGAPPPVAYVKLGNCFLSGTAVDDPEAAFTFRKTRMPFGDSGLRTQDWNPIEEAPSFDTGGEIIEWRAVAISPKTDRVGKFEAIWGLVISQGTEQEQLLEPVQLFVEIR